VRLVAAGDESEKVKNENQPTIAPEGAALGLAVVGAHLRGQPLNHQLTSRGAQFIRAARTADCYRLYALSGTTPPKPGLIRLAPGEGASIEVEIWAMTPAAWGDFVNAIPPPLGIGTLALEDGTTVKGFLCESAALAGAADITHFQGWRSYLQSLKH
jgi:allophanate hydrolase